MRNGGYYYGPQFDTIRQPTGPVRYVFPNEYGPHLSRRQRRKMRQKKKNNQEKKKKKDDKKGFKWNWKSVLLACLFTWCSIEYVGLGIFALGHLIHQGSYALAMQLFAYFQTQPPL